jgi:pilus assembly protein CpaF
MSNSAFRRWATQTRPGQPVAPVQGLPTTRRGSAFAAGKTTLQEAQKAARGQKELTRPDARSRYDVLAKELRPGVHALLAAAGEAWTEVDAQIRAMVHSWVAAYNEEQTGLGFAPLPDDAEEEIFNLLRGTGPLQVLLDDPTNSDIIVPGPGQEVIVERAGQIVYLPDIRLSLAQLRLCIQRMLPRGHPAFGAEHPEAQFSYGMMRVHALHESIDPDGPTLTIRKRTLTHLSGEELIVSGTLPRSLWELLTRALAAGANLIVAGPVGSAKTTLMGALLNTVPEELLVVTIEDTPELWLDRRGVRPIYTRAGDSTGLGAYTATQAARSALRMRPDLIVVGEMRDGVAYPMLRIAQLGQAGTVSTIHAEDATATLDMLASLARMHPDQPAMADLRAMIARSLHLVVVMGRPKDATGQRLRTVVEVAEVRHLEGTSVVLETLYERREEGLWCCGHEISGKLRRKFEGQRQAVPRLLQGWAS